MITALMALAGGLGAVARYGVDTWLTPGAPTRLPVPTLVVNVTGSFLLGLLCGSGVGPDTFTVLGTGLLGGYTTFSTASIEVARRALDGRRLDGALIAVLMLVSCVAAAALGVAAGGL